MISYLSAIDNWFTDFSVFYRFLDSLEQELTGGWYVGFVGTWAGRTQGLSLLVYSNHAIRQRFQTQMRRGYQSGQQGRSSCCFPSLSFPQSALVSHLFPFSIKSQILMAYVPLYICSYPCKHYFVKTAQFLQ